MATGSLGTLQIDVLANVAQMVSDLGKAQDANAKAARQFQKDWQDSISAVGEGFKKLAELAGVALTADAFKEVIAGSLEAAEKVNNLSQALGFSTQTIQTLGYAAGLVGGDLDTASQAMARMERSAEQAVAGNQQAAEAFRAIGISASQLNTLLKDPDQLIQQVAAHFAQFGDGAGKTAAVMQIFGRNAQQIIPLLNELGTQGMAELTRQAQELGVVLSDTDQKALLEANEGFDKLHQQVIGLGNQLTVALLPAINATSKALGDLLKSGFVSDFIRGFATNVNEAIVILGQLKDLISQTFSFDSAKLGWNDLVGDIANIGRIVVNLGNMLADFWVRFQLVAEDTWVGFENDAKDAISAAEQDMSKLFTELAQGLNLITPGAGAGFDQIAEALAKDSQEFTYATVNVQKYSDAIQQNAQDAFEARVKIDQWANGVRDAAGSIGQTGEALNHLHGSQLNFNADVAASIKAQQQLQAALNSAQAFLDKLSESYAGPYEKAALDYNKTIDQIAVEYQKLIDKGATLAQQAAFVAEATEAANEKFRQQTDFALNAEKALDSINTAYAREIDVLSKLGQAREIEIEYQKLLTEADKGLLATMGPLTEAQQAYFEKLHQMAAGQVEFRDATKQSEDALKEWQQLATSAFDQTFSAINKDIIEGGSAMKDLVNVAKTVVEEILLQFEKLAIINPLLNQIFGLSGSSLLPTLGNTALGSVSGGGGIFGSLFGGGALSTDPDFMAGGALAGTGAGGFMGGLFSGSSTALGGLFTSEGALGAVGAAIPWIGAGILAIGVLDKLSGGNVLGGSKQPWDSSLGIDITGSGISESAQQQFKKKGALFSGNSYSWQNEPVDQATQDAMSTFFTSLQTAANQEAASFGESTGEVISGSWKEVLDKNGKVLSQTTTIAGQQFTESMQDFEARILADTELANLGKYADDAQQIAAKWQSNAQTLLAGTQFLALAATDMDRGMSLISDGSLKDIDAIVEKLNVSGESLVQTYARLQTETQDVQQTLDELGLKTNETGADFVQFSDDMVKAAGSLQNLQTLWSDYFKDYYSTSEQTAAKLKIDQESAAKLGAAIGQDPNESMAQFRENFDAVFASLTPEQVVQWLQFAEALNAVNTDMGTTTAQFGQLQQFMEQFATSTNTDFENSIISLNATMLSNIDKANSYGASLQDIGTIMEFSAQQGVAAFQQFEQQTQQLAASLYGTNASQLQAQLDSYKGTDLYFFEKSLLQPQIDAANNQAASAKRLSDATTLLQDFGQVGAFTGESLDQIAQQFHVPLDKFAQDLGLDANGLKDAFGKQEDLASAALQQVTLLTDIRDLLEGKPIPVLDTTTGTQVAVGGKNVGHGAVGGAPVSSITVSSDSTDAILLRMLAELQAMRPRGSIVVPAVRSALSNRMPA